MPRRRRAAAAAPPLSVGPGHRRAGRPPQQRRAWRRQLIARPKKVRLRPGPAREARAHEVVRPAALEDVAVMPLHAAPAVPLAVLPLPAQRAVGVSGQRVGPCERAAIRRPDLGRALYRAVGEIE
jgi:hypothetical protein